MTLFVEFALAATSPTVILSPLEKSSGEDQLLSWDEPFYGFNGEQGGSVKRLLRKPSYIIKV